MRIVRCFAPDQDAQIAALLLLLRGCMARGCEVVRVGDDRAESEHARARRWDQRSEAGDHAGT